MNIYRIYRAYPTGLPAGTVTEAVVVAQNEPFARALGALLDYDSERARDWLRPSRTIVVELGIAHDPEDQADYVEPYAVMVDHVPAETAS